MHGDLGDWTGRVHDDPDGTVRVEVVGPDSVPYPIARAMTRPQADALLAKIGAEALASRRPVGEVVRDAPWMAATVIMLKRQRP